MPDFWPRMEKADPAIAAKATALRDHVFPDGIRIHARRALEHGATREEVHEAVALTIVASGIPSYREAIKLLWQELWPDLPAPTGR